MNCYARPTNATLRRPVEPWQYTSIAFGHRCKEMGVRQSMGSIGDAYDNAMAESFFASLECELIARRSWKTMINPRLAIFTWIESWYNPRRWHSGFGYLSPVNFERNQPIPATPSSNGLPTGGVCVACATPPVDNKIIASEPAR
jgi:putative transposase